MDGNTEQKTEQPGRNKNDADKLGPAGPDRIARFTIRGVIVGLVWHGGWWRLAAHRGRAGWRPIRVHKRDFIPDLESCPEGSGARGVLWWGR